MNRTRCTNCDPESLGQTYRPEWRECPQCRTKNPKYWTGEITFCMGCQVCSECGTTGAEMEEYTRDGLWAAIAKLTPGTRHTCLFSVREGINDCVACGAIWVVWNEDGDCPPSEMDKLVGELILIGPDGLCDPAIHHDATHTVIRHADLGKGNSILVRPLVYYGPDPKKFTGIQPRLP